MEYEQFIKPISHMEMGRTIQNWLLPQMNYGVNIHLQLPMVLW